MLFLELYEKTHDLYTLSFISNSLFPHIIVPNPQIADQIRENIQRNVHVFDVKIYTIAEFLRGGLENAFGKDFLEQLKSKEELILYFSTIWKKSFPAKSFENFLRAFQIFTELRSFTLNESMIADILLDFDEVLKEAIFRFWKVANALNIIDEHKGFSLLADFFQQKKVNFSSKETYVFWGFTFLTGVQIDLMKSLSTHHDVYIPIAKKVFEEAHPHDWVMWLDTVSIKKHSTRNDLASGDCELVEKEKCKVVFFPKGHLGKILREFAEKQIGNEAVNIYLGTKTGDYNQMLEIPFLRTYFKSQSKIFTEDNEEVFEEITDKFFLDSNTSIDFNEVLSFFKDGLTKNLKGQERKYGSPMVSIDGGHLNAHSSPLKINFRKIKIYTMWCKLIDKFKGISDANLKLNFFDFKILNYVLNLNLPRIYSVPIHVDGEGENIGTIVGLDNFVSLTLDKISLFCLTSSYDSLVKVQTSPMELAYLKLATIGPIKRPEFEFLIKKEKIREIVTAKNSFVFMEKNILEQSLVWKEVFENLKLEKLEGVDDLFSSLNFFQNKNFDYIKNKMTFSKNNHEISPTKLQLYIDCPRKYFIESIDQFVPRIRLDKSLFRRDLGTLEHNIVAKYFSLFDFWSKENHEKLAETALTEYLEVERISLENFDFLGYLTELKIFSKNAIDFFLKIKEHDQSLKLSFEKKIEAFPSNMMKRNGRVDCIVHSEFGTGIIDFKRSSNSIPSLKELNEFQSIQMWFYLLHLPLKKENIHFWGFFNLEDPDSSIYVAKDKEAYQILMEKTLKYHRGKVYILKEDFLSKLEEYRVFEEKMEEKIFLQEDFPIHPRNEQVCLFCSVKNICPRFEHEESLSRE